LRASTHSTQRLCKARTASDLLSKIHFWGWQLIIVGAAVTLPFGLTQGKEYAELIWPIDIACGGDLGGLRRSIFSGPWPGAMSPPSTSAIWFYIATIVTVAMLYVVNNLALPTSLLHSYPIFGGVQDALVQWWYGHNAVAFFLTTPILGIMYYLRAEGGGPPGLQLPAERGPLLVAGLHLHLGGTPPPAQHLPPALAAGPRNALLASCSGRRAGAAC
jgi:cytochrome c oxidase cbb3-type subunit I/II